jgi:hypothetical protein
MSHLFAFGMLNLHWMQDLHINRSGGGGGQYRLYARV